VTWTVNEPDAIRHVLGLKLDGIISDYPDRVRALLK
jgi:glycerophosphoryl diester phosphodiesterase